MERNIMTDKQAKDILEKKKARKEHIGVVPVTNERAVDFLKRKRAQKEHISISPADKWYAAMDRDKIVGVIGRMAIGHRQRVKGFFVDPEYRRIGIGDTLLWILISCTYAEMTAYATADSYGLFKKYGFMPESTNANNITYMRRR